MDSFMMDRLFDIQMIAMRKAHSTGPSNLIITNQVTACNMLCCYAEELCEGFLPYVKTVTDIMVPLLKFWFHEEVG
jgi:hypothetical protein